MEVTAQRIKENREGDGIGDIWWEKGLTCLPKP